MYVFQMTLATIDDMISDWFDRCGPTDMNGYTS